ncbi:MAG: type II toxin-antitoxin system HicB family antitoxin [Ruminococcaceae bacterium]|nr:type II toxin-antitoxin system HicB family antitoxin [Oscillospiraceae bacterium]MBQ8897409.1 type II toxin-antitoxin system HicB family antitoxin [Clostridia bacterium]
MKNILEYKGYYAKIEYSVEDHVLYGKIEGIKDLVNFESDSVDNIEKEFQSAVDDYLDLCRELGQEPDKAYSGTFNIRISPELHRAVAMQAIKNGVSLNNTVETALDQYVKSNNVNLGSQAN